ncbi:hypothetical protein ACHAWU_003681 [Discostella pseudostelligera]|uniref:Misato Segment II tubulin-like domain-containing protein n=1 Tax=Discostella pseudostelligera TaxID=259834 RepID=A0ABD3N907_9STRA
MASDGNNGNGGGGGEIVHISLGSTANYITSHLLNLQGLAATPSPSSSDGNYYGQDEHDRESSLCDPSVTHCIASSTSSSSSSSNNRMYVPRTLIVDGKDSFGASWGVVDAAGAVLSSSSHHHNSAWNSQQLNSKFANTNSAWDGAVSLFDPSLSYFGEKNDAIATANEGDDRRLPPRQALSQQQQQQQHDKDDPLHKFHEAASLVGLSSQHSRFRVTSSSSSSAAAVSYSSYNANCDNVDEDEEEEEEDMDEYDRERQQRQLVKLQHQNRMKEKEWKTCMETSWEEAFYCSGILPSTGMDSTPLGEKDDATNDASNDGTPSTNPKQAMTSTTSTGNEREIQWHDYWMPPRPRDSDYQVPLPFDSMSTSSSPSSLWSTSYNMGYSPISSGGGGVGGGGGGGGGDGNDGGITNLWREHALSEKLRRVLEASDVVKGFNVFVDGGSGSPLFARGPSSTNAIVAGGGFHAGLAASLLEELSEECRSAGRWAVMVDPLLFHPSGASGDGSNDSSGSDHQANRFRQRLNAGLALHGLSTNVDAFLPVSIDDAYRALYHDIGGDHGRQSSPNRVLFEGSAAISLALEASTLFYRLRRNQLNISSVSRMGSGGGSGGATRRRSRIGIQSGYYQGYGGSSNRYEECDNEPYATSPSMTYHEFLACLRPSSDRRRSVLELDALLHPISYPFGAGGGGGSVSSLLAGNSGNALPSSLLASLTSSGLIGNTNTMGELHRRMMRGTNQELMMLEQRGRQYRSSRGRSSAMPTKPGEWLDDISTKTSEGGGLLSSLSGNSTPFGRRSDHRHFALSTSLRPADSDSRSFSSGTNAIPGGGGDCVVSSFLRPIMESMGSNYRPEVSSGLVVTDSVVELTEVGSYWRTIFSDRRSSHGNSSTATTSRMTPRERASLTPQLSVLGNSTRSYPRLKSISDGIIDSLQSRGNMGYLSRDVMSGLIPEKDDCEEALEYCRELVDVYEPPMGSGLVLGEDENDDMNAYFDESDD